MKRREANSKTRSSFWLEGPVRQAKADALEAAVDRARSYIAPGFLAHHWSVTALNDSKKNWLTLEIVRRAKATFIDRLCRESMSQDARVLSQLAGEHMFEFAEFYYSMHAMGLTGADDIIVLLDLHNERVAALAKARLAPQRLAGAIFPDVDLVRLEEIWRDMPGGLEQSALARFLAPHMSEDSVHMLVIACEAAGFVTRTATVCNCVVVSSTGVVEEVMTASLRDMRFAIREL
ncbi:MAG: hypothetical protein WCF20_08360 [Methylovirgula sp.]